MKNLVLLSLMLTLATSVSAQKHKTYIREGNKEYLKNNYEQSEIEYRRALDAYPASEKATFNLGDALYKNGKYEEAEKEFDKYTVLKQNSNEEAAAHYNRANSFLKAGNLEKSIEAYKNSLLKDPTNHQAKYNLAYAQDQLRQQEKQENDQNQDQEQKDKNKNEDQENQKPDDKGEDKNDQQDKDDQQNKEQDKEGNQDQDQKPGDKQNEGQSEQKMTREDAERLLQALANDEQAVQEKVKKEKAAAARVRTLKNW